MGWHSRNPPLRSVLNTKIIKTPNHPPQGQIFRETVRLHLNTVNERFPDSPGGLLNTARKRLGCGFQGIGLMADSKGLPVPPNAQLSTLRKAGR
jgi:hypothetical protein